MKAPVKPKRPSSNVTGHTYDEKTGDLIVTFHGGRKYRYEGVDKHTAAGLVNAKSKGGFLHANVIGKFRAVTL